MATWSTDTTALGEVATSLLVRIEAALPAAVTGLGDDAAEALRDRVEEVHAATALMSADHRAEWLDTLERLTRRADLHGLLAGGSSDARRRAGVRRRGHGSPAPAGAVGGLDAGGEGRLDRGVPRRRRPAARPRHRAARDARRVAGRAAAGGVHRRAAVAATHSVGSSRPSVASWHQLRRFDGAGSGVAARTTSEWSDADLARATPSPPWPGCSACRTHLEGG